jgi:hypothetical protein
MALGGSGIEQSSGSNVVFGHIDDDGTGLFLPSGWESSSPGTGQYSLTPPAGTWRIVLGPWALTTTLVLTDYGPRTPVDPIAWNWRIGGVLTDTQTVFVGFDIS